MTAHSWDRVRTWGLGIWSALAIAYLFIPIFIIILFSFNDNKGRFNFTWQGFTLKHWKDPLSDPALATALKNSLTIAAISTVIATALGTFMALALIRYGFRGRTATDFFIFLPLATPEVVLGAALLGWYLTLNFARGYTAIVIAHVMFTLGYVVVTIRARLEGMDLHIEEAAMDLGAGPLRVFRKVTLPLMLPGILAAALLSFALSLDDFVITLFTSSPEDVTFPLYIYGARQRALPPQINVLATTILVVSVVLLASGTLWGRVRERNQAA